MLLALWNCSSTNRATIPTRHSMTEQLSVTWPRSLQTLDSHIFSLLGNLHTARNNMASTGINDIWRKHIPSGSQAWMRATFLTSSCCASMPYASYAKCTTLRLCNVQVQHFGPARFRFFSRRSWQQHIHGYVQHDWRGLLWDSFSIFSFITPSSDSCKLRARTKLGTPPWELGALASGMASRTSHTRRKTWLERHNHWARVLQRWNNWMLHWACGNELHILHGSTGHSESDMAAGTPEPSPKPNGLAAKKTPWSVRSPSWFQCHDGLSSQGLVRKLQESIGVKIQACSTHGWDWFKYHIS